MSEGDSLVSFITTGISGEQLERLFVQPYAVVAILRSLPPLARHMLLRFACTPGNVSAALVSSWAAVEGDSKLGAALHELQALRLLSKVAQQGQATYALHAGFQAQMRRAMCTGLLAGPGASPPTAPPAEELAAYARQQWEALLLCLVSGEGQPPAAPTALRAGAQAAPIDITGLLCGAGLMVKDEYTLRQSISERGFQFLLADVYSQLWRVVRQYLTGLHAQAEAQGGQPADGGADLAVAVNFLLRLGLQGGGAAMCYSQLAAAEQAIAGHMCQLGLLMPVSAAGGRLWVHPTHLAAVLASGSRAGEGAAGLAPQEDGYVIVESNFRVYAYTTSAVQVAVLRVFVRCDALLPNLFVGTITRESATGALVLGITAEQMAAFLRQHAHPQAAAKMPTVPPVVVDQLRLWQQELSRLKAQAGTLYDRFDSAELYEGAVAHAVQLGALLYRCDQRRQLAVASAFHGLMRDHLRQRKQQLGLA